MEMTSFPAARPEPLGLALGGNPVSFQQAIGVVRRRLRLFLGVSLVVIALVALLTTTAKPRYTAAATLLINQRESDVLHLSAPTTQDPTPPAPETDSSAVDTQAQILTSRALASRVVDQLHLSEDPEFNGALRPPSRLAAFKRMLMPTSGPSDPQLDQLREREGVVDTVLHDLSIKRNGLTYTIDLQFTSYDPVKAARIANTFGQRYLTEGLDAKIDEATNATSWLNSRLNQLRGQVQAADAAVEQYKISHNLLSAEGATLTEQEISNVDTQLATARAQQAEQDARLKTAQSQLAAGSNGGDIGEALNSPVVGSLRAQRAQASAHLADLTSRYGDKHPEVLKAERSLADIDAQIQSEISRDLSNLKAESTVSRTRAASLATSASQTRSTLAGNNQALIRLAELQRDDDAARAIYQGFLDRYKEANAKEGLQTSDARIVSQAKLPTAPTSPNRKLDLFLSLLLGVTAGTLSVLVAELLQRGVSQAAAAETEFRLPSLGEIPALSSTIEGRGARAKRLDPIQYIVDRPASRFAEAFRNLRTGLLSSRTGKRIKVIAVASSLPNEGKTTTAICLARTIALSGTSVVMVDCDLRQRSINRALKLQPSVGLLEVLNGTATLESALIQDEASSAWVLPLTQSAFSPRDVFGSDSMSALLDSLRARFDAVVLDTAPVLAVADTRVLAPRADVVLFIARWRKTSKNAIRSALKALENADTFVAGFALTQVNLHEQARSGDGAAHYYRAYRKYYVD